MVGHVDYLVVVDVDAHGEFEIGPLIQELSIGAEHLHPVVFPVANVDPPVLGHPEAVGYPELARPAARRAECVDVLAGGGEPVDTGITVPVGERPPYPKDG